MSTKLYKTLLDIFEELQTAVLENSKQQIEKLGDKYMYVMLCINRNKPSKLLASKCIVYFLRHYPILVQTSLETLWDLCRDEDLEVRRIVYLDLPTMCENNSKYAWEITEFLIDLMDGRSKMEMISIYECLKKLLCLNPQSALECLFYHTAAGKDIERENCMKYILTGLKPNFESIFNNVKSLGILLTEARIALRNAKPPFRKEIMGLLSCYNSGELAAFHKAEEELRDDYRHWGGDDKKLLNTVKTIRKSVYLFSSEFTSNDYFRELVIILSPFNDLNLRTALKIVRALADLVNYRDTSRDSDIEISTIYQLLVKFMSLPISEPICNTATYLFIEPLLYLLQIFLKQYSWLKNETLFSDLAERLPQFMHRLEEHYAKASLFARTTWEAELIKPRIKFCHFQTMLNIRDLASDIFGEKRKKRKILLGWKKFDSSMLPISILYLPPFTTRLSDFNTD